MSNLPSIVSLANVYEIKRRSQIVTRRARAGRIALLGYHRHITEVNSIGTGDHGDGEGRL